MLIMPWRLADVDLRMITLAGYSSLLCINGDQPIRQPVLAAKSVKSVLDQSDWKLKSFAYRSKEGFHTMWDQLISVSLVENSSTGSKEWDFLCHQSVRALWRMGSGYWERVGL